MSAPADPASVGTVQNDGLILVISAPVPTDRRGDEKGIDMSRSAVLLSEHETTRYYTRQRLLDLLRLYPYLLDAQPPKDPELQSSIKRVFGPGGWREEAAAKRADIQQAVLWLEGRDWRAAFIVRACYIVGLSLRHASSYLEREHRVYASHETVRRWKKDSIDLMADYLEGKLRGLS